MKEDMFQKKQMEDAYQFMHDAKYEKALEIWQQIAELPPQTCEKWFHLGLCEFELQQFEKAANAFVNSSMFAEPASKECEEGIIRASIALLHVKKVTEVFELLQQAIQHDRNLISRISDIDPLKKLVENLPEFQQLISKRTSPGAQR